MSTLEDIELNGSSVDKVKISEQKEDINEIEPTVEELATLEHVSERIPLGAWLIVCCELCERFAFYGLAAPFQNYIQYPIPGPGDKQPGALNRGQRTATSVTTFFQFFAYLTPIAGAILADQYWGKYKTILLACVVYMVGLLVLVVTSIPPSINAGVAFPGLIVAIIIISFGTGGVKSNVSPLMAEQYTRTKPIVRGNQKILSSTKSNVLSLCSYRRQKEDYRPENVSSLSIYLVIDRIVLPVF
ncbi:unnamed protein product [Rotaria sp. Silwood2]|nr:unnamed protein product [Rotaria sp. Silwood2]CAF2689637.1 unnamed protein product [Rotaria sp. Silwood2]CAF2964339.1 unnamed protein product [Rotaria sp. Silwood2]CAF3106334.1 unnamed protein product [Rotaria sp. Silwood2]CAF3884029.1 unnamed protein product [Rotaria sp. Silwood2]